MPHTCGIRRALFPVCGNTLFSLARQGREFLPGKFTDIDWMTGLRWQPQFCDRRQNAGK
jgi:hypothetical protein